MGFKANKKLRLLQGFAIAVSIVLIAAGLLNGEAKTVLTKAIYICLECIGIG